MSPLAARLAAYTAALNRFDLDAVEALFAEDASYVSPGLATPMQGRAAIMQAFRAYFADHPDQVNEDLNVRVLGPSTLAAEWKLAATHARSGHRVSRQGRQVISFTPEGLIQSITVQDG